MNETRRKVFPSFIFLLWGKHFFFPKDFESLLLQIIAVQESRSSADDRDRNENSLPGRRVVLPFRRVMEREFHRHLCFDAFLGRFDPESRKKLALRCCYPTQTFLYESCLEEVTRYRAFRYTCSAALWLHLILAALRAKKKMENTFIRQICRI